MTIPTVCLTSEEVANTLFDACTKVGFFYLEGHGISQSLLDKVFQQSQNLFALPEDQKVLLSDSILQRGYTRFEEEALDPKQQPTRGDTKEGFYIGDEAPPEETDAAKLHGPNVWPQPEHCQLTRDQCLTFRKTMEQYRLEATRVCRQLLGCFSLAVGAKDPHLFDQYFTEPKTTIRLLHYSAEPSDEKMAYENPGLQVKLNDGSWIDIPPKRGAFVVNIGDTFERWTNGIFKSTVHRVITPKLANERFSITFFFEPNFDALVECLESCCSEDNPPKYPPVTAGQHLLNMYEKTYTDFDHLGEKKSEV